jgi:hypothetical protein
MLWIQPQENVILLYELHSWEFCRILRLRKTHSGLLFLCLIAFAAISGILEQQPKLH